MNIQYFKDLVSLDAKTTKDAFFNNIKRSFKLNAGDAFLSTIASVLTLIALIIAVALGLAVGVICLVLAILTGCSSSYSTRPGEIFASNDKNMSATLSAGGFIVAGVSLFAAVVQAFALPFQILALPVVLVGSALKSCLRFITKEKLQDTSNSDCLQSSSTTILSKGFEQQLTQAAIHIRDNDQKSAFHRVDNVSITQYAGTQFAAPITGTSNISSSDIKVSSQHR